MPTFWTFPSSRMSWKAAGCMMATQRRPPPMPLKPGHLRVSSIVEASLARNVAGQNLKAFHQPLADDPEPRSTVVGVRLVQKQLGALNALATAGGGDAQGRVPECLHGNVRDFGDCRGAGLHVRKGINLHRGTTSKVAHVFANRRSDLVVDARHLGSFDVVFDVLGPD